AKSATKKATAKKAAKPAAKSATKKATAKKAAKPAARRGRKKATPAPEVMAPMPETTSEA
ncbi:MAG TPA: hypothetical protein PKD32_03585, partial [Saprospiraceae bacterium]|nr:hypothetical protein [Saprospiraceae bacterium]